MDFPRGANTNIHLIDGFSNVYWRIYTEEVGITNNPQEGPANGYTILKHLSRLKDLEARLRNLDCLASCPRRLGLWVFSPTPDFESLKPLYVRGSDPESNKITIGTTTLKVSASGSVTSLDLVKGLSSDNQSQHATQSSGQPRPQQGQPSSRRQDSYSSSAAIYASFISAVTGAISLQLIRHHGALPLGSRTLFTAVEKSGYEVPHINNDSPLSTSCLTTLNVQLTMAGTITVSAQTISQTGILRLCNPRDNISHTPIAKPGADVWLCPNGTIARLVTANVDSSNTLSPDNPLPAVHSAKQTQWKSDVLQWLQNFGLGVGAADQEPWVEVEVWEPFFARLAGEAWRQSDDNPSMLPLKRMLWPARFCFRRASSSKSSSWAQTSLLDEPLDFAEQWPTLAGSLNLDVAANLQNTPTAHEAQPRDLERAPSPKVEPSEIIESLSRIAQYPDLQSTNLVYPTPPDGAVAVGPSVTNTSEAFVDAPDFGISRGQQQSSRRNLADADSSPIQNNGIGVGTGRYDESDEEDLFGEINGKDFGSKGITDADFSFFDEPDFDGMGGNDQPEDFEQALQPSPVQSYMEPDAMVDEPQSPNLLLGPSMSQEEQTSSACEEPTDSPEQLKLPNELTQSPIDGAAQTLSPPLSPVEVKKILFDGTQQAGHIQPTDRRGQGHYLPVTFENRLGNWDQKYGATGKFWFSAEHPSEDSGQSSAIPTIGLPRRARGIANGSIAKDRSAMSTSVAKIEQDLRSTSVSSDDSDDSDDDSVEIASEPAPTPKTIPTIPSLKRKRAPSEPDTLSIASPTKSLAGTDANFPSATENSTFLGNFLANFSDWTFTGYFSASTPQQHPVLLRREHQLQVAQLLVDQITQSSLKHSLDGHIGLFDLESQYFSLQPLEDIDLPGDASKLDLKKYTSLQDELFTSPAQQPQSQAQPSPKDFPKSLVFKLPAPHVRIRRGKGFLETLPPAVSFWETFGLEPAHGAKDISAYCIHPPLASKAADAFLDRFGLLYRSCNLGSHTRGECSMAFEDGLRPWQSESPRYDSMMQLAQSPPSADNCVIYIINPFKHAAALADICSAFWHLFQQLLAGSERRQARPVNELVLQIIPLEFVMSSETMIVPPQSDYLNLALEVYGRCRPMDVDTNPLLCAPPILLADPLPTGISFRLASERASPLKDGRSLHIACSKSLDQRWISVAWSDVPGSIQRTMSYCLRYRQSGSSRPISEIRQEIWTTTKHIMDKLQARWKIQLVTTEPMEPDEVEGWANLAEQHNKLQPGTLELTILAVNVIPDLILEPPCPSVSMSMLNSLSSSTPVTTPNPSTSIASPEQYGNAATPTSTGPVAYSAPTPTDMSLDTDPEAVLIDICDDHLVSPSQQFPHLTEFRPALSSGYLLRRKGTTDSDGVFAMAVNLIYSPRPASSHDDVLKKTLCMYRDMSCLARAKGTCSVQNNTLPWHIVTALRAQELLSYVF
ncbi:uncharacterized protein N7506_003999 [Penicillium brevicompactum]|uniref:uncharacterized protein n=1 Tax=Penicillium brevicompactum TaxID=5074 RepID=UPI00253FFF60|nr:uncharacterized protein N7506_003999 [Penicillium brevicompactum]KAJ5335977.1 hypothetical protein N7506_003999 [Penicillium brevicompactum]